MPRGKLIHPSLTREAGYWRSYAAHRRIARAIELPPQLEFDTAMSLDTPEQCWRFVAHWPTPRPYEEAVARFTAELARCHGEVAHGRESMRKCYARRARAVEATLAWAAPRREFLEAECRAEIIIQAERLPREQPAWNYLPAGHQRELFSAEG